MASPTARQLLVRALPGLFPDKDPEFRGKAFLEIAQMQSDVAAGLLDLPEEDRRAAIEAAVHRGGQGSLCSDDPVWQTGSVFKLSCQEPGFVSCLLHYQHACSVSGFYQVTW
jgi:hypothetical protein